MSELENIEKLLITLSDEYVKAKLKKNHNDYLASKEIGMSRATLFQLSCGINPNPTIKTLVPYLNYIGYEIRIVKKENNND